MLTLVIISSLPAQSPSIPGGLTLDRIFHDGEFYGERWGPSQWLEEGEAYTTLEPSPTPTGLDIVRYTSANQERSILISAEQLIPEGQVRPLSIQAYEWSHDRQKLLIFTNTRRVWRTNSRGDYWVYDLPSKSLNQLGKSLPGSSLMFAKFSPDDQQVAYVSKHNVYVENLNDQNIRQLTFDGTDKLINGTFDWAYEEEFFSKDGFRWSADGKYIAFWQVDASDIPDFLLINNTDSVYSQTVPIQYPKAGHDPSACKVGTIEVASGKLTWLQIPGDPQQNYLPRMQWIGNLPIAHPTTEPKTKSIDVMGG